MDLSRNGFTHDEIKKVLHSSNREVDFRYELLDKSNSRIRDLTNVISAKVSHSMLGQIKRTAQFVLTEDGQNIDYINNRIKPYMKLYMPKTSTWIEFSLGVFLLSSPTRSDEVSSVQRNIDAYDLSLILRDDKFLTRHTITEGTSYYNAIVSILTDAGLRQYNIERTSKTLSRTVEFEMGTEKLEAVNELLSQLNYNPIHVDADGHAVSSAYISPSDRASDYDYIDDEQSVTLIGVEQELDTFNVPNVFMVVRTNDEELPLVAAYTNNNPNSPLSTVNRGRNIVDYRELTDIADQDSLNAYVNRIAFEASQVYGRIVFKSALMPVHGYGNVLYLHYQNLGINGKYLELNWSMDLKVGGEMTHELRQVVTL